ncbi:MAG: DNA-3-methyladenine glycosylase I [Cytophagales bacterium]|nr:DNA-3-methyladenine glycosylase I [Armatimonadota bacterium]
MSLTYCQIAPDHPWHGPYHENQYGFPLKSDADLFERLALEINQAGLSWLTILQKQDNFRRAFAGFDPATVAAYGADDEARLLADAGIIRNRLKVRAVIENARRIVEIEESHGSFLAWLNAHHPLTKDEWTRQFKKTFLFTGGEIVGEFLMSTGYLPGAHTPDCPVYARVLAARPAWSLSLSSPGTEPQRSATLARTDLP